MSKTTKNATRPVGGARGKAAVIAAGLGVSMAVGAGSAVAAQANGQSDVFASGTAGKLAQSARHQAESQHQAAAAKKKAEQRQAEQKKSARDAERKKLNSWTKPVVGKYDLSAGFGTSGDRWSHKHSGQDFAVPTGTSVKAVHGGTVVKAGGNGAGDGSSYGNAIVIKHEGKTYSQYAHLSSLHVKPGEKVKTGQEIGLSGSTGNSSGPHLHFEIRSTPDYGSGKEPVAEMRAHGVHV